jgi:sulfonate transport system permease protein
MGSPNRTTAFRKIGNRILVVLWQLFSATGLIPGDVLPAPQLIFDAGLQLIQNGKLVEALEVSGLRIVEGLLLGDLAGLAVG